jgi:hypothetical protein
MFDPAFPNSTASDNTRRCAAMTLPRFEGDLPMYRCTSEGARQRAGRLVCEGHSRKLKIRFCDEATRQV